MPEPLSTADLTSLLDLLEECERASDLAAFRQTVIDSLARFFDLRHATFFVGRTFGEVFTDQTPLTAGRAGRLVTQYIEDAHRHDPFAQAAVVPLYRRSGVVSLDHLTSLREHPTTRDYLEKFLFRGGIHAKLVIPLPTEHATGGIGLLAEDSGAFGLRELALARVLSRHLTNLFRLHHLPSAPPPALRPASACLSPRQAEVVRLVSTGMTNSQVAATLGVTVDTIKKHLTRAMEVTGSTNRTQLALAWRSGAVRPRAGEEP